MSIILAEDSIIFNEINYNSADSLFPKDWVELYNVTTEPINIGNWIFKDDNDEHEFIIPDNYKLIGQPGLKLILNNQSSILSYSNIEFIGNKYNPITISSEDFTGQGIIIFNSNKKSIFKNVIFDKLSNPKYYGWNLTGVITTYHSKIEIYDSIFKNNQSEDYINFIDSEFIVNNSSFNNIYSDGIDSDYSNGNVVDTNFNNTGNDAIDLSGSKIYIKNVFINSVGDKGLSVGERSTLYGKNIHLINN